MKFSFSNKTNTKKVVISAMFLAIGVALPFLTGQIKEIGDSLLPMHFPVMICGLILGGGWGLAVGAILPFLRAIIAGMPPIYPNAVWMSLELATYGFVVGILYFKFFKKQLWWLYSSMFISMMSGRVVWGVAKTILLGLGDKPFTFEAFIMGGFIDALPGIILQLIIIPVIVKLISKKN